MDSTEHNHPSDGQDGNPEAHTHSPTTNVIEHSGQPPQLAVILVRPSFVLVTFVVNMKV